MVKRNTPLKRPFPHFSEQTHHLEAWSSSNTYIGCPQTFLLIYLTTKNDLRNYRPISVLPVSERVKGVNKSLVVLISICPLDKNTTVNRLTMQ